MEKVTVFYTHGGCQDYLRTSFIGSKGRGNRKFEVIIIDEIDNICLDNIMNQTELVDNFK